MQMAREVATAPLTRDYIYEHSAETLAVVSKASAA
jgi:hypothetical protein